MGTAHTTITTTTRDARIAATELGRATKYEAAGGFNETLGAFTAYTNGEADGWTSDGRKFTDLFSWLAAVEALAAGQPALI